MIDRNFEINGDAVESEEEATVVENNTVEDDGQTEKDDKNQDSDS